MFSVKVHELEPAEASLARGDDVGKMKEASDSSNVWSSELTKAVSFTSGNPRVETVCGIMHLFRDVSESPHSGGFLPTSRNEQLCVLAIPNHMTGADFCQFIGAFLQNVKEVQFVRNDGSTDRYSALMKLESQSTADDFFKHYNGKPFSSFEEEVCHVLFTADVHYTASAVEASSPPVGLTELPTCPVCLERLDQHISGILTTVCNHSFHSSCISKWTDSSCPVCHYCQERAETSTCTVCSTSENLWICVICGFVGCGRYQEGHAIRHWKESQHCYSLEVETQRVWDYVGDGYVHRLIQSKTDGKLVELNAPCRDGSDECGSCECSHGSGMAEAIINSKRDGIAAEYTQLLTGQLDKQRQYFEGLLTEAKKERDLAISEAVEKAGSLKLQKMQAKLEEIEQERRFLEQVNEAMKANQESWQSAIKASEAREKAAIKERDDQIADLEEQVRDLMVYIEAQKTFEASAVDIRDGTVLSLPTSVKQASRSSKVSGRKKR
ncbi:hypothetical protein GOP47_0001781 [Adiantum capillus-veneris]|uniref:BRCA1-associated protein n=1 Tax=Adiantum capillus-veneris TaxID=13818 RepID=A0A9D4VAD7_ADICA|nr:hypothetical protein GOP47_0001781 [Adiantum capillus-veneris]